jgi:hypothetical protein
LSAARILELRPVLAERYVFGLAVAGVFEFGRFLPAEGFSPQSKQSFPVKQLVDAVKDGFIVDVHGIFQKYPAFLLLFLVIVVLLYWHFVQIYLLKLLEDFAVQDVDVVVKFFLVDLLRGMHVPQYLDGGGSDRSVQIAVDFL